MELRPELRRLAGRAWWVFAVRGVAAIAFGLAAFFLPGIALTTLVLLVAAWMAIEGISAIGTAVMDRGRRGWWVMLLEGVAALAAGLLTVIWPLPTTLVLLFLVAGWSVVTGVLEVWAAIRLREHIRGELFLGLAGILSIGFGVYIIVFPGAGILSLLWLVGLFALLFGFSMLSLGWRLRGIRRSS
jgi:uncharacterized membrane protein HdeD (DUF308 family)